jgi:hypothetical protein
MDNSDRGKDAPKHKGVERDPVPRNSRPVVAAFNQFVVEKKNFLFHHLFSNQEYL